MSDNKKYVSLSKLQTFLDNLSNKFASLTHAHTMSDITDYTVDTELSSVSTNPVQNKTIDAEFEAVSTAMGALESAIDGKADEVHTHDDATTSSSGFMTAEMVVKLSNIDNDIDNAINYSIATVNEVEIYFGIQ